MGRHGEPRSTEREGSNGSAAGRKTTGNRALNVGLVDVHRVHREALRQACMAAGCPLVVKTINGKSTDRLGPWADLVVVEADRGYLMRIELKKTRNSSEFNLPACRLR